MWVLMIFYFSSGAPAIAMHDFADQAACERAAAKAQSVQGTLKGYPQIVAVCSPKSS